MQAESMIIFTRTYDLISWLIPRTMSFPRSHRFVVTRRLEEAALNFEELIVNSSRRLGRARLEVSGGGCQLTTVRDETGNSPDALVGMLSGRGC